MQSSVYTCKHTSHVQQKAIWTAMLLFPVLFTISSMSTWRMCESFALWSHKLCFIGVSFNYRCNSCFCFAFFFLLFQPTLNALECALLPCFTTLCFIRHLMCLFLLLSLALPCFYYIHLGILLLKQGFLTFWYNGCPNMIILKKNKGSSVWSIIKTKTNLYG